MVNFNTHQMIRAKKLGVLIRDARQTANKGVAECAQAIQTSIENFEQFEVGERSPSLPELELLAQFLKVPLDHFWGNRTLSEQQTNPKEEKRELFLLIRNRKIGVILKQARLSTGLSINQVSEQANISDSQLEIYELGEQPIPLPILEDISNIINLPIQRFFDVHKPIDVIPLQPSSMEYLNELPKELRDFILKPVNRPYLELAHRLSEISVEKLRTVAEGLLEITL